MSASKLEMRREATEELINQPEDIVPMMHEGLPC